MRLLFAGTPATAVPSLRALLASRHQVVGALTRPDAPAGRGGRVTPSPIAAAAGEAGLPVLKPPSIRTDEFADRLRSLDLDAVAVVAFGALIPQRLLQLPRHGWINLHFSLLPAWRGAAPVPAAIRAGDEITGASTFLIEKGLDTGPVFGTITEPIGPRDTAGDLLSRLAESGARLLVTTMDGIEDGVLTPRPQPLDGVSHTGKITPDDAEVDLTAPAMAVDRMIRSVTPSPGAWVQSRWGRLGLGPVEVVADATGMGGDGTSGERRADAEAPSGAPGEMVVSKREVLVRTGSGMVRLGLVRPPGKREMPAPDWARGARPELAERLGPAEGQPAERLGPTDGQPAERLGAAERPDRVPRPGPAAS